MAELLVYKKEFDLNPHAIYVPCSNHSHNLTVIDAANIDEIISFLMLGSYFFCVCVCLAV